VTEWVRLPRLRKLSVSNFPKKGTASGCPFFIFLYVGVSI